ncbi:MCE family protein [Qaidamihabitans albus]|uniref:MCE family protein n=1 Tax=Qaidamihabitans albus TaxID=2795733 RepID=UPI0018F1129E|nr:MCE family protein [Qaidamihabitans albus]
MRGRALVAGVALCAVTAACSPGEFTGIHDLPLPGGADLGDDPYRVTVQFDDVLDLVPHAAVKVNDVPVGTVESIGLGGARDWTAEAVLAVNGDVELPADAVANVRQSSLLGEKFVELAAPHREPGEERARLADGALIPVSRTNRHPEIEEVFGALSLLLNGGGIGQLQTINRELSNVLTGNEERIRSFLSGVDELVSNLDSHRGEITAALDGLNRLASTLAGREEQISAALTELTPGLRALSEQRGALVTMLQSLDELSTVAVDTIERSRRDMVADLEALAPILRRLADAGQDLPRALEILPTFPFTDAVLDAVEGDYLNVFITMKPDPGFTEPLPPLPVPPVDGDGDGDGGSP